MATEIVAVQEAEGHLLELIGLVEQGKEVVIVHNDQSKVKLVLLGQPPQKRVFAQRRGKVWMAPTLTPYYRMTAGSVATYEVAARSPYLPVVG